MAPVFIQSLQWALLSPLPWRLWCYWVDSSKSCGWVLILEKNSCCIRGKLLKKCFES